jgi:hypothetical protein
MHARQQYLAEVRKEYQKSDGRNRSRLLDEAEKRIGLNRKYLIRVLNQSEEKASAKKRRRRRAAYGAAAVTALIEALDIFEQPCGQRLVAVLRSELERLRRLGEVRCSDTIAGAAPAHLGEHDRPVIEAGKAGAVVAAQPEPECPQIDLSEGAGEGSGEGVPGLVEG